MEKVLDKVSKFVVKYKFFILGLFVILMGVSGAFTGSVKINEDMTKYLPNDSATIQAIQINGAEFGNNEVLNVMVKDVLQSEVGIYRNTILNLDKVEKVSAGTYKDNNVLYSVTLKGTLTFAQEKEAVDDIRNALASKKTALQGNIVNENYIDKMSADEAMKLMIVLIPLLLLILILSTRSFIDPLLCIIVLAVTTLIGMGTNAMFASVSSITSNMFSVLMIAISMDYSIFLLHTYKEQRDKGLTKGKAVMETFKKSFTTITSAGLTTIAGFIAMVFMKFGLGADLGWVFAKGIFIAVLTALFLMPVLLVLFDKWITKTTHKNYLPSFKAVGKAVVKSRWVMIPAVIGLIVVGMVFSLNSNYTYGNDTIVNTSGTVLYDDNQAIVQTFGETNNLVLLVPRTQNATLKDEYDFAMSLNIDNVKSVTALSTTLLDAGIVANANDLTAHTYTDYDGGAWSEILGQNYTRIILNLDAESEGTETFALLSKIQELCPDGVHMLGASAAALDLKNIVGGDYLLVTLLTIVAIGLIIGLSFKSGSLPFILLLCVQGGVFINMAIPAMMGASIPYIAYLIIGTIQLGVTIDYSILMASKYMANRKVFAKKESAIMAIHQSSGALLTGAGILMAAGFAMFFTSGDAFVSQMGMLLGRGALISLVMALTFLPAMLMACDKIIKKTTYKPNFIDELKPKRIKPVKVTTQTLEFENENKGEQTL